MFGRKRMSEEEIQQRLQELETLDGKECFDKAIEVEKYAPAEAAFFIGLSYFVGEAVEQNYTRALSYMQTYVKKHPNERGLAWYIGAIVYYVNDDYVNAVEWYKKAIDLGIEGALTGYAFSAYMLASETRSISGKTLKINEYNMANQACIRWYMECCNAYTLAIEKKDGELDENDWCVFAKCADMLLAMSYQGTMVDLKANNNGIGTWVKASFRALDAKMNEEQNEYWKAYAYAVAQKMEEAGKELVAETLRLFTCLNICRYEKKAEVFYRAQWHRDYVFELLNQASDETKEAWNASFSNLSEEFSAMERKYERIAIGYMLDGILPNIADDYPMGQAKDPEISKSFMNRFHVERGMAEQKYEEKNTTAKKGKGLFGLFRK